MSAKIHDMGDSGRGGHLYAFHCPGCGYAHALESPNRWRWNGSLDRPTFTPSLLVHESPGATGSPRCHSYVTDGKIQFLTDSGHALAGKTVEIPDWDE